MCFKMLFHVEGNFRDVDQHMMLKWHVQQCVYYYYTKVNLMKYHRQGMNIRLVLVQCVFDI
jgi:hypothetical protein